MSDLIDRQQAIDAFWKLEVELRPSAIDAVLDMLKCLPSAQFATDINVGDTIYRQDAIKLYEQFQPYIAVKAVDFKKALEQLPSAQTERPEQPESAEEYCAECDHIEMCRWYPYERCEFRSLPSAQPERKGEANEQQM